MSARVCDDLGHEPPDSPPEDAAPPYCPVCGADMPYDDKRAAWRCESPASREQINEGDCVEEDRGPMCPGHREDAAQ